MKYKTSDIAIIIPTKDRPFQVKRHLQSLVEQKCKLGRIIVVASGQDIKNVVLDFKDSLPVEYYSSEPGQIRQRNIGISKLDEKTKLVATMDDDVTYHKDALKEMIIFWKSVESETAGVGFNVINAPPHKHNWFRYLMGFSVPSPGRIFKSGWMTPITNVSKNIKTQFLQGGTTVWRQDILKNNLNNMINHPYAVMEDIMFSYPIGKNNNLYVCSKSEVDIEDDIINDLPNKFFFDRGRAYYLQGLYFIIKNSEFSIISFLINKFLQCIFMLMKGIIFFNKRNFYLAIGIINGFLDSIKFLLNIDTINDYRSKYIDLLK